MKKILLFILPLAILLSIKIDSMASTQKTAEINDDFGRVVFEFDYESETHARIEVYDPNGESYTSVGTKDNFSISILNPPKGTYKIVVDSDTEPVIQMKTSQYSYGDITDDNITVEATLSNLKYYFVDGNLHIEWDNTNQGDVLVKVTNPQNMQSIFSDTIETNSCDINIPEEINQVALYIVPAKYSKVNGSGTTYTLDVVRKLNVDVQLPTYEYTNQDTADVTVYTDEYYYKEIIVENGQVLQQKDISTSMYNHISFTLMDEINNIVVYISDENGNMVSYSCDITKDLEAPQIKLTTDLSSYTTTEDFISIAGRETGASELYINSLLITPDSDGNFETELPLTEIGENYIQIHAEDLAGNKTDLSYTITREEQKKSSLGIIIIFLMLIIILMLLFIIFKNKKGGKGNTPNKLSKVKNKKGNLEYEAFHDELTGLKNRRAFDYDLDKINSKKMVAVSIDVNFLKKINDTYGHEMGDKLLSTVANVLYKIFKEHVYRTGGDEFYVLLDNISKENIDKKFNVVNEVLQNLTESKDDPITYSIAYGVAYGDGLLDKDTLLKNADAYMYQMKTDMKARREDLQNIDNAVTTVKKEEHNVGIKKISPTGKKILAKRNRLKTSFSLVVSFLLVISLVIICNCFVMITKVQSGSMTPTLDIGDLVLFNKCFNEFNYGDIIIFESDNEYVTKRIVGLSGDEISFKDGYLFINGNLVEEGYISSDIESNSMLTYTVGENEVFVLGDNRENSVDSRYIGNINIEAIKGKYLASIHL